MIRLDPPYPIWHGVPNHRGMYTHSSLLGTGAQKKPQQAARKLGHWAIQSDTCLSYLFTWSLHGEFQERNGILASR